MPRPSPLASSFCHCIKRVRKSVRLPRKKYPSLRKRKESAAIAICVKSVLHSKNKTLKRFTCKKKPYLLTKIKSNF